VKWSSSKQLDEKKLKRMLQMADEQDWLEYKRELKLFSDGKVAEKARDEFIKDILALANGNSHTIRKTKYIIIGADNKQFDENGERVRYCVNYQAPTQSEIAKWLSKACSPAVVGLECEMVTYKGDSLFVITIPPTFDLHETTRELNTPNGTYREHTVLMRHDEHVFPASVRDGITIQQLKHLYRQEITNPPSIWTGAIVGGIIGFISSQATIRVIESRAQENLVLVILTVISVLFGASIGMIAKWLNETRYDWRYMTWKQRTFLLFFIVVFIVIYVTVIK